MRSEIHRETKRSLNCSEALGFPVPSDIDAKDIQMASTAGHPQSLRGSKIETLQTTVSKVGFMSLWLEGE